MAKQSTPRGLRDEASVGPDPRRARHLVPLKELGKFKVASGDPDIRGWAAYTSTGREIGRVNELLVDTDTNEVVMLDVDLRRDDRHTLVPLRAAWVDHAAQRVVVAVREVSAGDELPSLSRVGAATEDELRRFDEGYDRAYANYHDDRELRLRDRDGELRFGRRAGDREQARAEAEAHAEDHEREREQQEASVPRRSRFVERHDIEDAERYRVVDRGEREVRVPRHAEEVVVERRPLVEEVVVRRRDADAEERREPERRGGVPRIRAAAAAPRDGCGSRGSISDGRRLRAPGTGKRGSAVGMGAPDLASRVARRGREGSRGGAEPRRNGGRDERRRTSGAGSRGVRVAGRAGKGSRRGRSWRSGRSGGQSQRTGGPGSGSRRGGPPRTTRYPPPLARPASNPRPPAQSVPVPPRPTSHVARRSSGRRSVHPVRCSPHLRASA
jgi:hypothetical protein